jgi:two-component system chemotaxis response regulator CheB
MPKKDIKVLIVDDSAFMRKILKDILDAQQGIIVVGTARNGIEAIDKIQELQPDIVTLDVEMPKMNGLEVLKIIMKQRPVPVIMLSSLTQQGAEITLKALELGAVDFIPKPAKIINIDIDDLKRVLIEKIITLVNSKVIKEREYHHISKSPRISLPDRDFSGIHYIIGVGTSTGGPSALKELLISFPENIPAAILIVQHMPPGFTKSLAQRLNTLCHIRVKEGEKGERLKPGWAYIAPGNYHMIVHENEGDLVLDLNTDDPVSGHRPSVDVLMKSISRLSFENKMGIIMTGMGRDGSQGIRDLKRSGGFTIAQDEESCVVFGMPKAAIDIGAVDKVLPLQEIGQEVLNYIFK